MKGIDKRVIEIERWVCVICFIGNHSLNAFLSRVILIRDIWLCKYLIQLYVSASKECNMFQLYVNTLLLLLF